MVNYLDTLAKTIRENWDQPALTDFYLTEDGTAQDISRGNRYTYGEMYAEIVRVADLLTRLGLQKGDHIAICGANSSHWVIAYLAIAKMQGVSVTIMHSLQPDQIAQLIDFSDAKALFVDAELWMELKEKSLPQVKNVIGFEEWTVLSGKKILISNLKSQISNSEIGFVQVDPNSLAMICFTSGSTGKPKGVMLSIKNISACVRTVGTTFFVRQNNRALSLLPLTHIFCLGYTLVAMVDHAQITIPHDVFSSLQFLTVIDTVHPYALPMVPQILKILAESNDLERVAEQEDFLDYLVIGGAGVPDNLLQYLLDKNIPVTVGYGSAESSASISMIAPELYKLRSSGKIVETLQCRIAPNGEILVKGENVMLGYYKDPEATAQKIDKDGWLHTGDKGHLDEDGYLYVEGRLEQDIIVLPNGENIRPDNIEALINAIPEVSESLVLARNGHLIAKVVVPQYTIHHTPYTGAADLRRNVLRQVNPQLPLFSQLYDVEITDQPLARTEKQTIKRYLYR